MLPEAEIHRRLDEVRGCIGNALVHARRPADSCRLVLATKIQPAEALLAAYNAGARDFGENYVQEAAAKRTAFEQLCSRLPCRPERSDSFSGARLPREASTEGGGVCDARPKSRVCELHYRKYRGVEGSPRSDAKNDLVHVTWHLIGHLQTNKAATALANFSLIHSLDSARLAATLHRLQPAPLVRALLEINLGGEFSKTGVAPAQAEALLDSVREQVEVLGLMTIPPHSVDPSVSRPYFVRLRELRDRLAASSGLALSELSMGMTDDYIIAIEEGATIVRVGRAVFGERT